MAIRYHITLPNPDTARGSDPAFAFRAHGAAALAAELQDALRTDTLFKRWVGAQEDPDDVDPELGAKDPVATVEGLAARPAHRPDRGDLDPGRRVAAPAAPARRLRMGIARRLRDVR